MKTYKLGELITQRREKNNETGLPIRGVSREGLIPPKQIDADTSIYNVFYLRDFIFNPARMELNSIAFNDKYEKAICSSLYEVFYVHREDIVLPEYLKLIVKQDWFTRYCEFLGQGSAREYCRFANISEINIELPDIETQKKAVYCDKVINERIALKRRINDNLEAQSQAILTKTVCDNETISVSLGDIVDFIDGDRGKNYPTFDEFSDTGYCLFLNASNVTSTGFSFDTCQFVTKEKDEALRKGHLSRGDIVLTSRGTLGNVAYYNNYIPFNNVRINSGMLIIRPKTDRYTPVLLFTLLKSGYMKAAIESLKSGSAQPQLPIKDLQKAQFEIPTNDSSLQQLSIKLSYIDNCYSENCLEIMALKNMSMLLLSELSSR